MVQDVKQDHQLCNQVRKQITILGDQKNDLQGFKNEELEYDQNDDL